MFERSAMIDTGRYTARWAPVGDRSDPALALLHALHSFYGFVWLSAINRLGLKLGVDESKTGDIITLKTAIFLTTLIGRETTH